MLVLSFFHFCRFFFNLFYIYFSSFALLAISLTSSTFRFPNTNVGEFIFLRSICFAMHDILIVHSTLIENYHWFMPKAAWASMSVREALSNVIYACRWKKEQNWWLIDWLAGWLTRWLADYMTDDQELFILTHTSPWNLSNSISTSYMSEFSHSPRIHFLFCFQMICQRHLSTLFNMIRCT